MMEKATVFALFSRAALLAENNPTNSGEMLVLFLLATEIDNETVA